MTVLARWWPARWANTSGDWSFGIGLAPGDYVVTVAANLPACEDGTKLASARRIGRASRAASGAEFLTG